MISPVALTVKEDPPHDSNKNTPTTALSTATKNYDTRVAVAENAAFHLSTASASFTKNDEDALTSCAVFKGSESHRNWETGTTPIGRASLMVASSTSTDDDEEATATDQSCASLLPLCHFDITLTQLAGYWNTKSRVPNDPILTLSPPVATGLNFHVSGPRTVKLAVQTTWFHKMQNQNDNKEMPRVAINVFGTMKPEVIQRVPALEDDVYVYGNNVALGSNRHSEVMLLENGEKQGNKSSATSGQKRKDRQEEEAAEEHNQNETSNNGAKNDNESIAKRTKKQKEAETVTPTEQSTNTEEKKRKNDSSKETNEQDDGEKAMKRSKESSDAPAPPPAKTAKHTSDASSDTKDSDNDTNEKQKKKTKKKKDKKQNKKNKDQNGDTNSKTTTTNISNDTKDPTTTPPKPTKTKKPKRKPALYPLKYLPSGVQYQDLRLGRGRPLKPGRITSILYQAHLHSLDGPIFDKCWGNQKKPFQFRVGTGQVIKGLDEGLEGMKVGGERVVIIPSEMGYGKKGVVLKGGKVPKDATLVFEVQLVDASIVARG